MNCGPIQSLLCGPLDVTISTCDSQRSSPSEKSTSQNFSLGSMRFLSNQFSCGSGGWISMNVSFLIRFHWARGSTCSSMHESSFCLAVGIPKIKIINVLITRILAPQILTFVFTSTFKQLHFNGISFVTVVSDIDKMVTYLQGIWAPNHTGSLTHGQP